MSEIETVTRHGEQEVLVFRCDQQLYRVVLGVIWASPEGRKSFYPGIGGMHWVMSCTGFIGKLMVNSGLGKLRICRSK